MCTALSFRTNKNYFGRNLDYESHYGESIVITPRNMPLHFRKTEDLHSHYAFIGVATLSGDYPLYYDGTNEEGLSAAGLCFPGNACYLPESQCKNAVAPFEVIPLILGKCKTIEQVQNLFTNLQIAAIPYSQDYPLTDLHWMVSDRNGSIVIEQRKDGLKIFQNPLEVLTNNPPFEYHWENIKNYLSLQDEKPTNKIAPAVPLSPYSRGMGAMGLPGDFSSSSRFVKAVFTKFHSAVTETEEGSVHQFFHILDGVAQQDGCVKVGQLYEKTIYSCCCNADEGIYYYKTYENSRINAVQMGKEHLDADKPIIFPFRTKPDIFWMN